MNDNPATVIRTARLSLRQWCYQTSQMMDRYTTISAIHTKHLSDYVDENLLPTSKTQENIVGGACEQ